MRRGFCEAIRNIPTETSHADEEISPFRQQMIDAGLIKIEEDNPLPDDNQL